MAQGESFLCYLDSLIKLNIIYGPQGPNLHYMAQKYKAQIYSTWPICKAQIILNYSKQFIQIRGLLLNTLFFLQRDFFMFVFGLEQLIKNPNNMRWAQSSKKLLILPLALCPLYSLINVIGAYSINYIRI